MPPRNDMEIQLISLWEGVLQARPIGIRDDFFELGGHSLSAVQVAAAIGRMLNRSLSPGLLFETPTIETLAGRLATARKSGAALVPLAEGNSGAPLFLIHHVSGDITSYRDLARYLGAGKRGLADEVRHQLEALKRLPGNQRVTYVWRKVLRRLNNTSPPTIRQEDPTKNAVWSAMERAIRAYRPRAYPGAITLFRATDRSVTGTYSRTLGWGRLAKGGVRVIDVPGSHSTVLRPGAEPPMAAKLRDCLDELTADQFT